jgi:hypothetical protein
MLIGFGNGVVVWEFLNIVFINFGSVSKCFKVFFVNVEEVRREWDGLSCEVWK